MLVTFPRSCENLSVKPPVMYGWDLSCLGRMDPAGIGSGAGCWLAVEDDGNSSSSGDPESRDLGDHLGAAASTGASAGSAKEARTADAMSSLLTADTHSIDGTLASELSASAWAARCASRVAWPAS